MKIAAQSAIFGRRDLTEIFSLSSAAGLAGVELFPGQIEPFADAPERLRQLLGAARLELAAVFIPLHQVWGSALQENATRLDRLFRIAHATGCELIEWGGGLAVDPLSTSLTDWRELVDCYHRCASRANREGLRSVFHPQVGHSCTPTDIECLARHGLDFDQIELCPDSWQIFRAGGDPLAGFIDQAPRIGHYHLADCTADGLSPAPFGEGALPMPALIAQIASTGYDGWIVLDSLPPEADPAQSCRAAADYITRHWPSVVPAGQGAASSP